MADMPVIRLAYPSTTAASKRKSRPRERHFPVVARGKDSVGALWRRCVARPRRRRGSPVRVRLVVAQRARALGRASGSKTALPVRLHSATGAHVVPVVLPPGRRAPGAVERRRLGVHALNPPVQPLHLGHPSGAIARPARCQLGLLVRAPHLLVRRCIPRRPTTPHRADGGWCQEQHEYDETCEVAGNFPWLARRQGHGADVEGDKDCPD